MLISHAIANFNIAARLFMQMFYENFEFISHLTWAYEEQNLQC